MSSAATADEVDHVEVDNGVGTGRKVDEVERTIRRLRLSRCANMPINMISGGEKKRVNTGSEPLMDPAIMLLDEPTLGLNSTSAVALMRILHDLARDEGKMIMTSIHQPSSAVFFAFNALMLLADGKVKYLGMPDGMCQGHGIGVSRGVHCRGSPHGSVRGGRRDR